MALRGPFWLYLITVGLAAGCGLVIEIVAGRMLAPYLGMSLYTWTAVIAVVLAGFSAGHWVGGRIADWEPARAERTVSLVLLLSAFSAAGSLILLRILSGPVLGLGLAPVPTIVLLTSLLFFLPSFFVGIPSPVLTKLAIDANHGQTGRVLGGMYASGAFGGILGTLAAGYFFISWLGTIWTILTVASVYLALAASIFLRSQRASWKELVAGAGFVFLLAGLIASAGHGVLAFRSNCTAESSYYCIRVIDISPDVGAEARLMVLDHLGHGMNLRDDAQYFLSSYVELTDRLVDAHLRGGRPFRAYFVGGGAYTLPRAWAARRRPPDITVAELDPAVTRLANRDMWASVGKGIRVRHMDGRRLLREEADARYDVVIGDAFHDIAVPQHLITREFFELVRDRLTPGGIFLMTAVDIVGHPRFLLSLLATLRQVFPVTEVWLDDEQQQTGGRVTFIVLAADKETGNDILQSDKFPERGWHRWDRKRISDLEARYGAVLLTDDYAPVDRLLAGQ